MKYLGKKTDGKDLVNLEEIPTSLSQLTNDSGFITGAALAPYAETDKLLSGEIIPALSKNIFGKYFDDNAEFVRRPTAGLADVESGTATFKSFDGNTIVWNQLVMPLSSPITDNGVTFSWDSTNNRFVLNGTATDVASFMLVPSSTGFIKNGHKYLGLIHSTNSNIKIQILNILSDSGSDFAVSNIWSIREDVSSDLKGFRFRIDSGVTLDNANASVCFFDLTQMFGAGNEPTTVEEFKALFPNDYYAYNAGQLLSLNMTGIKTVGFNQWDEEWELGRYDIRTGEKASSTTSIRSTNKIPVYAGMQYYFRVTNLSNVYARVLYYDGNDNYLSSESWDRNSLKTIPVNTRYITFYMSAEYGTTYNHDICINLSHSGVRNGEYEPYWTETRNIPVTTIKGKVNGQGESVVIFPDGMKSAGTAHDEIVGNKAIKRIGVVDLGSLSWSKNTSVPGSQIYAGAISFKAGNSNGLCLAYRQVNRNTSLSDLPNESFKTHSSLSTNIYVRDDAYTDVASFKAAMSGVMLYYELAEPIEYIIDEADVPNYNYKVSDFGTETLLPEGVDASGVPMTSPIKANIHYGINVADTVKNLPHTYRRNDVQDAIDTRILANFDNYLPLAGGTITGNLRIDKDLYLGSTSEISSAYLSIHPEKVGPNILPFFTNDIAFLLKRGGYAESYYTTATNYTPATIAKQGTPITDLTSCFDASAEYCQYSIDNLSSKVVIDLTLHTSFYYSTIFYIDFGQSYWGAKKITVLAGKDNGTYTEIGQIDSTVDFPYYKCNLNAGETGVNKIRIVLTNYNTTTPRIAEIGLIGFSSRLGRETFMSRGADDELFRNLVPQTPTYNLGETNKPWGKIYANKWYPKAGDESVYIEYDTTNNCFKVHGTIMATGNVVAGQ